MSIPWPASLDPWLGHGSARPAAVTGRVLHCIRSHSFHCVGRSFPLSVAPCPALQSGFLALAVASYSTRRDPIERGPRRAVLSFEVRVASRKNVLERPFVAS